ncbi:fucolectin-6-like [Alosa sapidissima]|uniref:fucolectin-6-like n=1 Tax=Alosa sapidissima TaxID=34773 RepID=UPI001C0A337A|nr:fucolectin-6-like [Alosa sapidissima]
MAKNLALYGKATQSDLIENPWSAHSDAHNAIDGNRDPHFFHGSCTATDRQSYPWWRVDLLSPYIITSVVITNRGDIWPERLNGAEIRIGNSLLENGNNNPLCAVISSIPARFSETFECHGMEGRYVTVVIPRRAEYLTLCEVEVYGSPLD